MNLQEIYRLSCAVLPILMLFCSGAFLFDFVYKIKKKLSRTNRPLLRKIVSKSHRLQLKSKYTYNSAHGIIFGKRGLKTMYSETDAEGHVCVFGGTGSGKTSALLIPTLRSWTGSSLVIDISGDISKNIPKDNKLIYEPLNPESIPYNIFAVIDEMHDTSLQDEALEQLALLLMPLMVGAASDTSAYFQDEGRKLLTAALIAFYHAGLDFSKICRLILSLSFEGLQAKILATKNRKAALYINSFSGINEKNAAGCKQACDRAITLFATNDVVAKNIRRPNQGEASFSPHEISSHNVFIIIPDERLNLLGPLLRIIVAQSLNFFAGRSLDDKTPILFCLDEFASFGRLDMMDALRKLRKRHIRIMILTQALADIDMIYGQAERNAMLNNFKFKSILGIEDRDTQRYFSDLIGSEAVPNEKSPTGYTDVVAVKPYELGHLRDELILIHPDGYMRMKKNYYFKRKPRL